MDYTKVPRELIYKKRNDLKEFGVQIPETMNYVLFMRLKQQALMGAPGAREIALRCYNNAYYVCTLILLEANDFPELRISDYVNTILEIEKDNKNVDETCLASMAMACLLLARYDSNKYGKDSEVWKAIYHRCTHYQWYNSSATGIFHAMMMLNYNLSSPLSFTEFAPRDIVDVIENFNVNNLIYYPEYICERLALIEDLRLSMKGADTVIARLKDYQRELCEDSEYDPKKDSFNYSKNEGMPIIRDISWEDHIRSLYQQSKEAIDYYREFFQTKEENNSKEETVESAQTQETEALQVTIRDLQSKLSQQESKLIEVSNINNQYANRIKKLEEEKLSLQGQLNEAHTIPDTVTAQQRVRMELARILMDAAGINEDVLAKWGNKDKAGTIMGTMLDIRPSTCKTYLSDPMINYEYHKKTVDIINPLLETLGLKLIL